ncbi:MAG TPA: hypothetical protein VJJ21_01200 [Candidatus Nanoarchaeia archaeon]|nr:hypothetical protein [Candidatus Nanoarchaeia archaeon]
MKTRKFLKIFGFDLGFFVLLIIIFAFLRAKIRTYLSVIGDYNSLIAGINPENDLAKAVDVLQGLSSVAGKAYFLILVAPIVIYLVYVFMQGMSFNLNKKDKYLLKFSIASLPGYVFLLLAFNYAWLNVIVLLLFFVLCYFTFLFYLKPYYKGVLKLAKDFKMILYFIAYLLFFVFIFSFFMIFYLETLADSYMYAYLIFALIFILGLSRYKLWLVEKFS